VKIVVNNQLINYNLSGQGKMVLLVHGWGQGSKDLQVVYEGLKSDYQVVSLDLPGFGESEPPKQAWDMDNYVQTIEDFLTKLNLTNVYAAIGHSNGGAILIRAVSTKKISLDKLILIASAGIRDSHQTRRVVLKIIAKVGNVATFWLPSRYRQALRLNLYGVAGSDEHVLPELKETFRKIVKQDVKNDASKVDVNTLIINADGDKAIPVSDGQEYNRLIKNSRLAIVNNAGHFIQNDQPEQTLSIIKGFLK
jgi:pimeloyl-ACP methyl ester carboxylesterase